MTTKTKTTTTAAKSTRTLANALIDAQMAIGAIQKDSTNQHSRYKYTSAEHMIRECRSVLHDNGILVEPVSAVHVMFEASRVDPADKNKLVDAKQMIVQCRFLATFVETCESKGYSIEIPVQDRKGTPYDKASLASQTTALNYFLRNLLMIPRVDEEVCSKNDADQPSKVAPAVKLSKEDSIALIEAHSIFNNKPDKNNKKWLDKVLDHFKTDKLANLTDDELTYVVGRIKKD